MQKRGQRERERGSEREREKKVACWRGTTVVRASLNSGGCKMSQVAKVRGVKCQMWRERGASDVKCDEGERL